MGSVFDLDRLRPARTVQRWHDGLLSQCEHADASRGLGRRCGASLGRWPDRRSSGTAVSAQCGAVGLGSQRRASQNASSRVPTQRRCGAQKRDGPEWLTIAALDRVQSRSCTGLPEVRDRPRTGSAGAIGAQPPVWMIGQSRERRRSSPHRGRSLSARRRPAHRLGRAAE